MRYLLQLGIATCNAVAVSALLYTSISSDMVQIAVGITAIVLALLAASVLMHAKDTCIIKEIARGQSEIALRQLEAHPTIPEIAVRLRKSSSLLKRHQFRKE